MEIGTEMKVQIGGRFIEIFARALALLCLWIGLSELSRLLGVSTGDQNPVENMGATAFVYLAGFAVARLFCAVGLWINSSWGAVVLFGAAATELVLAVLGNAQITLSGGDLVLRIILLLGSGTLLIYAQLKAIDLVNR
jgi:hypothetical protein